MHREACHYCRHFNTTWKLQLWNALEHIFYFNKPIGLCCFSAAPVDLFPLPEVSELIGRNHNDKAQEGNSIRLRLWLVFLCILLRWLLWQPDYRQRLIVCPACVIHMNCGVTGSLQQHRAMKTRPNAAVAYLDQHASVKIKFYKLADLWERNFPLCC